MQGLRVAVGHILSEILTEAGIDADLGIQQLQQPRQSSAGDLCLPCFSFATTLRKAPAEIADELGFDLRKKLSEQPVEEIGLIETKNGYLNIFASKHWLVNWRLESILERPENAGRGSQTGLNVLIEHTSANPNGPFHVGRARNAILGDALVRLHRVHGNQVQAEYYVDDMGKQVGILAWALANLSEEEVNEILTEAGIEEGSRHSKADHHRVRFYQAANLRSVAQAKQIDEDSSHRDTRDYTPIGEQVGELVLRSEEGDEKVLAEFEAAYQPILKGMLETLEGLDISYDSFTRESQFILDGSVAKVMDELQRSGLCGTAKNGALYLELADKGVSGKSTKFFFQRGDGSSLYASRDIAYHKWKWTRADQLINVLGEDHRLQSQQVQIALNEIGVRAPEVVFYSFIKLPDGKMSTRRGNVVFMDDLLDEGAQRAASLLSERRPELAESEVETIASAVTAASIRFNILKVSPEKGFTFRWEDALSFESDSAPFIMYSHARSCSISRKLQESGHNVEEDLRKWKDAVPQQITNASIELIRVMGRFEDAVSRAVELHKPSHFCSYLLELASSYNAFYRDCPVLLGEEIDRFNLVVNEACKHLLRTACEALGIKAIESM